MEKDELYILINKTLLEIGFELIRDKKYEYRLGRYIIIVKDDKYGGQIGIEAINTDKNENSDFDRKDFIRFTNYISYNDSDKEINRRLGVFSNSMKKYPGYQIFIRESKIKKLKKIINHID